MKKKKRKISLPPGSVIHTGDKKVFEILISIQSYNADILEKITFNLNQLPTIKEDRVLWIDIRGVHDTNLLQKVGNTYNIHSLVLEDIADVFQRPKLDEYKDALYIVLKALWVDEKTNTVITEQVSIYHGSNFVLSFQENESDLLKAIKTRLETKNGKIRIKKADYLVYAIVDVLVDNYYLVLDNIEHRIDELEEEILNNPEERTKEKLHHLKREIIKTRKFITPLRDAIGKWFRIDSEIKSETTDVYIRDLFDHILHALDSLDSYRDTISGLHDLYLSEISFRMNNVMQVLTIIATIFIPLTFLAGIYGMNFEFIPELNWKYSYFVLWAVMIGIGIALLLYFRRKKWL